MTFWQKLAKKKKPFLALAPMEEVTDTVFRQIVATLRPAQGHGPDVMFTEFTNVEGIVYAARYAQKSVLDSHFACACGVRLRAVFAGIPALQRLCFSECERPIVAQIWGKNPENFYEAAKLIKKLRFDGVDINMGCPVKDVVKNGCCIALVNNRSLAAEIIAAVKEGAGSASRRMPVSVKTRIGLDKIITEDWCGFLLEQKLDALTVHGRTAKEKSDVPAHWEEIAKVVGIRNYMKRNLPVAEAPGSFHIPRVDTLVIGNGDVKNAQDAMLKAQEYGVDGVMIGRGVFDNLWCFGDYQPTREDNLRMLVEHAKLWEKTWGKTKNFAIMKKFVKAYVKGWEGAGELRARLMEARNVAEVLVLL